MIALSGAAPGLLAVAAAEGPDSSSMIIYASLLLAACVGLFMLEFFIPSLGLIAVFAVICSGMSIWFGFQEGQVAGYIFVCLNAGFIPASIFFGFKLLTRFNLTVNRTLDATAVTDEQRARLGALIGKQGKALTMLRPAGSARVADSTVSVQTRGEYVEQDAVIEVVAVEGNRVIVKSCGE